MRKKRIDYDTILACKRGDSEAFKRVLEHYDKMINQAATRTVRDEYGNEVTFVDPEIKQNIQQTLMLQIYLKYDHLAGPPENKKVRRKLLADLMERLHVKAFPQVRNGPQTSE